MAVITNDIYTKEDAEFLVRRGALPADARRRRRDRRLPAHGDPRGRLGEPRGGARARRGAFPDLDLLLIESGGDNLAATFSPELVDATIYVIDVAEGEKIPRKGGPGHHALRPARHQQDRPGALRRRRPRGDGARRAPHARRAPLRVHEPQDGRGRRRDRRAGSARAAADRRRERRRPRVGRDGTLRLRFERRGAATVLAGCRFTLPLQVLAPLALDDPAAVVSILNPTGGVARRRSPARSTSRVGAGRARRV